MAIHDYTIRNRINDTINTMNNFYFRFSRMVQNILVRPKLILRQYVGWLCRFT